VEKYGDLDTGSIKLAFCSGNNVPTICQNLIFRAMSVTLSVSKQSPNMIYSQLSVLLSDTPPSRMHPQYLDRLFSII